MSPMILVVGVVVSRIISSSLSAHITRVEIHFGEMVLYIPFVTLVKQIPRLSYILALMVSLGLSLFSL